MVGYTLATSLLVSFVSLRNIDVFNMSAAYAKRFQAVFLCLHPKAPKISVRSAAEYLHKSQEFVNKWIQRYKDAKCVDDLPDRGPKRTTTAREDFSTFFQKFTTFAT